MKRHDPQILKVYGLTEEDAANPGAALLSEGVKKLWKVMRFMKLPLDLDAERKWDERAAQHADLPIWQALSGLRPKEEMAPEKREAAIEELIKIVLHFLRFELKAEAEAPNQYHTVYWDPLPKICASIGLARAELSRLAKEGCGLAAHELVDVVRVKTVKETMKKHARVFIAALNATEPGEKNTAPTTAQGIYKMLQAARRGPHFHRGQWALTFGFSNHARFLRACLAYYKLAPQQVELMAIEEVLKEMKAQNKESSSADDLKPQKLTAFERLKRVVWDQLKAQHVLEFAEAS
ncbi:MAG TPA: hypothetical protein VEK08_22330 [Planctomycetota bacterium]|nr:hypothetical protein [Planctomycetota bacterium]